jgi:hypothetical protein
MFAVNGAHTGAQTRSAYARRRRIMGYPHFQRIRWEIVAALLALASISAEAGGAYAARLPVEEKVIPLTPSITFVKASFLTGALEGLRAVERIGAEGGTVIGSPTLQATLTVSNDSRDHAARLLGGTIEYLDPTGKPIAITGAHFTFTTAATDRLEPGQTVSEAIVIPFPMTALQPHALREVSLELTYLPIPYATDTVHIPVYLGG